MNPCLQLGKDCPQDQVLMGSPSGNTVIARQENVLILLPTQDIYLQAV